jgi:heat shock protein HtpX
MINQIKTAVLLAALTGFLLFIGAMLGGQSGLTIAILLAFGMNFISYFWSDKIVLRMYRAKKVEKHDSPKLHALIGDISKQAEIPMPKIYIVPSMNPNAFATGRNPKNAAVAVTAGILKLLNHEELKGVIAHELAHIKNRDILISTVVATIAGAISYLAFMARWAAIFGGYGGRDRDGNIFELLFLAILAPLIAMIIQLAISRSREYLADRTGAKFIHSSEGLASALAKLGKASKAIPMDIGNKATEHLFIVNPFRKSFIMSLFSTHPPMEERVKRLEALKL